MPEMPKLISGKHRLQPTLGEKEYFGNFDGKLIITKELKHKDT